MKSILYMAATMLLCTSCFHVNTNWTGSKDAIKGEGPVTTKTFEDLTGFDEIQINGHADVHFTQSSDYEVKVRTQESVLEWLDYKVEDNTLIIETKEHRQIRAEEYDLYIQAPTLKKLVVNGAADFELPGLRSEGDLRIEINGAGDLSFANIECKSLTIHVNGAADADLTSVQVLEKLKIEVNGAGDVNVDGKAGQADLSVNGAGDIDATGLQVAGQVSKRSSGIAKIRL